MDGEDVSFLMMENRRLLRDIEMLRETNGQLELRIMELKEEIKNQEKFYLSN